MELISVSFDNSDKYLFYKHICKIIVVRVFFLKRLSARSDTKNIGCISILFHNNDTVSLDDTVISGTMYFLWFT